MAAFTAADVKNLREKTGAGMMDAKKALEQTGGDIEAAVDALRAKGLATAAKKSSRTAAEGLVEAGMTRWGAFLLVGGVLLVLGLVLGAVGVLMLKRVQGPTRAVEQGKGTVEDVKDALSGSDHGSPDGSVRDVDLRTSSVGATAVGGRAAGRD